jgi:hypothetical protein
MPRAIDRERINRTGWVLCLAFFALGTIWLASPAHFAEQLSGGRLAPEFYRSLTYDETFRRLRLPPLLALIAAHLGVYAALVVHGRWRRLTRRLDMILSVAISGLLAWSLVAGRIYQGEPGDRIARSAIWLIVVLVLWDVAVKLHRQRMRVRMPRSVPQ